MNDQIEDMLLKIDISTIKFDEEKQELINEHICPFCEREMHGHLFTLEGRNGGAAVCRHCNYDLHWICNPFVFEICERERGCGK